MDPVLYWNEVALEANRISHTDENREQNGPTLSSRALAIVHLAMYDAYVGTLKNEAPPTQLEFYLEGLAAPPKGASPETAIAAAAHTALSALYPSQRAMFDAKYEQADLSSPEDMTARTFGCKVAKELLKRRQDDPDDDVNNLVVSKEPGAHRPDPDNPGQRFHGPFYGSADLFASQAFDLPSPPDLEDSQYTQALQEVHAKGVASELMGTLTLPAGTTPRTPKQTLIGLFWAYDGASKIGTPPRLYNQIVRLVAEEQGKKLPSDKERLEQNLQLFALVNTAMADAGILAWREKYRHNLWRPVLGIREHDASMGPLGKEPTDDPVSDMFWLPLGAPNTNALDKKDDAPLPTYPFGHEVRSNPKNFTPNFPAYPSGHATFGAAALHMTRLFFGVQPKDHENQDTPHDLLFDGLTFVSDELDGVNKDNRGTVRPRHTRSFSRGLWQMIMENAYSRVYLGVHWNFDSYVGKAGDNDTIPEIDFPVKGDGSSDEDRRLGGVYLGLNIAESIFTSKKIGKGQATQTT